MRPDRDAMKKNDADDDNYKTVTTTRHSNRRRLRPAVVETDNGLYELGGSIEKRNVTWLSSEQKCLESQKGMNRAIREERKFVRSHRHKNNERRERCDMDRKMVIIEFSMACIVRP